MHKTFIFLLIASLTPIACPNKAPGTNPAPAPIGSQDAAYCAPAAQKLSALCSADPINNKYCCQTVQDTKMKKDFTTFCQQELQLGVNLYPKCLSQITSCDQIDTCTQSRK